MRMLDLPSLFFGIESDSGDVTSTSVYAGIAIAGTAHHIAKDSRGRPVVLIAAEPTDVRPASIVLENLRIEHGLRCSIAQRRIGVLDGRFSVLHCESDDKVIQRCFLDLCEVILAELDAAPTQRAIADKIDRMVLLFRALEQPPLRSIQGLWGELLLIVHSNDPVAMTGAWHNDACERYDFAAGEERLEVKTSGDRARKHFLSHEQANPPSTVQCVIASLFVEASTGGLSLGSLWDRARTLVATHPEMRTRIDEVSFASLGSHWRQARSMAFDEQQALSSLKFYDVRDIPRIEETPLGVSDIRFRSDLSLGRTLTEAARPLPKLVEVVS